MGSVPAKPEVLYHISDIPDIPRFEPRPHSKYPEEMVWAIDAEHLHNYYLPRQCPRVTFYALPESKPKDVERLMCGSTATYVVAIEARWMPELLRCRLYQYAFSAETFTSIDPGAGYYLSRQAVTPLSVTPISDVLGTLLQHDVELRVMPSLWKLREAVIASSLQFSINRMGNAAPPSEGYETYHPLP
jgi:hypothetical protein